MIWRRIVICFPVAVVLGLALYHFYVMGYKAAVAVVLVVFAGTLTEYLLHRAMHEWGFFSNRHWLHHKKNHAHEWLWDAFFYYFPISSPFLLLGLIGGKEFFIGWVVGDIGYCFLLSLAHYVQHHYPRRVFWMKYPIHKLHHHCRKNDDCYNYGILTTWWDHFFGTYHVPGKAARH